MGIVWGIMTVISMFIFFAEIINTISEQQLIPLGKALFDFKKLRFQYPFSIVSLNKQYGINCRIYTVCSKYDQSFQKDVEP